MLSELLLTLGVFTLVIIIFVIFDGLISGFRFKELRKTIKYILIIGYIVIALHFVYKLYIGDQETQQSRPVIYTN